MTETDPCASIRQDIDAAQKTINDDEIELSHFPEDLTAQQKADLKKEIAQLERKLTDLNRDLERCEEAHRHGAPQTVPSEAGWEG